jgi:DNA polymerase-3 subunit gamma/tau
MTLYRKYRPQIFKDLIGQKHIKTTLENEIRQNKIAHAYLFTGPRGIGKTTMARLLAKALNCQRRNKGEAEPCNKCFICQEINYGHFLDLIEIDAASNRGINEIRELRDRIKFAPSQGKYKVFVIDESHMLTMEAFNALLKTLEEPPSHAIFILATTEPHKLPETIISRCQRFDFKKIDPKDIAKRLGKIAKAEGVKVDKEVLEEISRHSQGSSRDAESLLGQILSLEEKKITLEQLEIVLPRSDFKLVLKLVDYLTKKDSSASLKLINQLIDEGVDLEQFTSDLIEFLRKILIFKIYSQKEGQIEQILPDLDKETNKKIQTLSQEIEIKELIEIIELFVEKKAQLKWSEIPQLPLELAVIEITAKKNNRVDIKEQKEKTKKYDEESESQKEKEQKAELTLEQIQDKWQEILSEIKKRNHSLSAFLKMAELISWEKNLLTLAFPFKFHQERIRDAKNKKIIEEVLSKILEVENIQIKTSLSSKKEEGILGKIASVFGGKIEE